MEGIYILNPSIPDSLIITSPVYTMSSPTHFTDEEAMEFVRSFHTAIASDNEASAVRSYEEVQFVVPFSMPDMY
jgi:hypothetical protein